MGAEARQGDCDRGAADLLAAPEVQLMGLYDVARP
jgi:hypothetical protein